MAKFTREAEGEFTTESERRIVSVEVPESGLVSCDTNRDTQTLFNRRRDRMYLSDFHR